MKLIFMGTPEFSVPVLDALIAAGHDIAAVYCQPPRPAGRGKKERPSPVHARALEHGLDVRHPVRLGVQETREFAELNADAAVVVAYGLILPQAVLDAPQLGCLNIHASLLPRWRGAAPIHRAIMAGDTETGVGIMQMEAGLDTGPVLLERRIKIYAEETTSELHDRLSTLGAQAIVEALVNIQSLIPTPQTPDGVTYAHKIDKAEAKIDWAQPATVVDQLIRGLSRFPGAWSESEGTRIKFLGSSVVQGAALAGEVISADASGIVIACSEGAVRISRLQRAGKSVQMAEEFLRGMPLRPGTKLG